MKPDQLSWTLGPAPEPGDPPLPEPPARPRRSRWSWRRWSALVAVLIAGTLAAAWGYGQWSAYRLGQDLNRLIAAEAPPVALPAPVLRRVAEPPHGIVLTRLSPDRVRADVTRAYLAPDGATLHFTLPQFYDYRQGAWQAGTLPADWSTLQARSDAYADFGYSAGDADLVEHDLAPFLDDVLARACADWTCPPGTRVELNLSTTLRAPPLLPDTPAPDDPLLFAFTRARDLVTPNDNLLLPAPHAAGYPTDPASLAWWQRAVAVQALSELATRLSSAKPAQPSSDAFMYALVERLALRLGLESAPASPLSPPADPQTRALATNVNAMSDLNSELAMGGGRISAAEQAPPAFDPAARDTLLRSALAATNWLLRGQPAQTDARLLQQLRSAHNETDWLAQSLGISDDEAWTRMQLAVWQVNHQPDMSTLALACAGGVAVTQPGQAQPIYFWAGSQNYSDGPSFLSPDGQWLVLGDRLGPVFVGLETGALIHTPTLANTSFPGFAGWASNTVTAYITVSNTVSNTDKLSSFSAEVDFVDITDPGRVLPPIANAISYRLSPDRRLAAILAVPDAPDVSATNLAIVPALGGTPLPVDTAAAYGEPETWLAWSPDSTALVYAHRDAQTGSLSLRVADAATGASHEILNGAQFSPGPQFAMLAWSGALGQIGFVLQASPYADNTPAWLGLVGADGAGLSIVRQQPGTYSRLAFSADGQYLAATYYTSFTDPFGTGQTLIFDTLGRSQAAALPKTQNFAWSASNHQLAIVDATGTTLLTALPNTQRQPLTQDTCNTIAWGPQP